MDRDAAAQKDYPGSREERGATNPLGDFSGISLHHLSALALPEDTDAEAHTHTPIEFFFFSPPYLFSVTNIAWWWHTIFSCQFFLNLVSYNY